ncbi:MAG TPA: CHAT domain-containing protein [Leptolyngbyaceae cyanobacterium]
MQTKHWLPLSKPLLKFIILATASLILTLTVADILSAIPANGTSPPTPLLQGEGSKNFLISSMQGEGNLTPPFPAREGGLGGLGFSGDDLNNLGRLQLEKGEAQAALNSWKQAELAYEKNNNVEGVIGSQLNQAQALQALGQYHQSKKLLEEINLFIEKNSDSELKVIALRSYGDVLRLTGELKKSEEVLTKSLNLAEFQYPQNITEIKLSLGNTALAQAKRAKAVNDRKTEVTETQKALEFYQAASNDDALTTIKLQAQLNLLRLLVDNNDYLKAENLWSTVRNNIAEFPVNSFAIEAKINLADSSIEIKRKYLQSSLKWQDIYQILADALPQAKSLQDMRSQSYALGKLGSLYEAAKQYSDAMEVTKEALSLAQSKQAWDIAYQWQWQLGRLYNNLGEKESAIAYYTTAVNTLNSVRQNLSGIDTEAQFSFRDDVEPVYRELVDLLLQSESGENEPSQENIQKAIEQIDGLQLAEIENFLKCELSGVVKVNQITDEKAAIIYPIILEKRLAVIWQLPGQAMKYHQTIITKAEVEKTLQSLRKYLSRSSSETPDVIQEAAKIYQWIIKPFEQSLETNKQINTLVFVLDGALRNIPMAVLYDDDRQEYLIQKDYAIAIAPRLELFTPKPLARKLKVFIGGIGEPQTINNIPFPEIKYLDAELQGIAEEINTNQPLLNAKFTKTNLQHQLELGDFSAIHIKTHGLFSSDPENTFIVGYKEVIKGEDLANLIQSHSQENSNNLELLVLSACETAKGDNRAVLGLAGIAVRAGARSTLSTLWKAQDEQNTELMLRFYQELSKPGTSRAKALHIAQKALFDKYQNPHIWATYILVGNWL